MKDIIYDVLVSAFILSLIATVVIPSFRNDTGLICGIAAGIGAAGAGSALCPDIGRDAASITGCEAVSVIRYYEGKDVAISVSTVCGGTYVYEGGPYIREDFRIPYDCILRCCLEYEGTRLTRIRLVEELE